MDMEGPEPAAGSVPTSRKLPGADSLLGGLLVTLLVFTLASYGSSLNLPFMGDDYVFLDKTRDMSFWQTWSRSNTDFEWYRPWSREVHFWALQRLAGPNEGPFRGMGVALWLSMLALYTLVLLRVTSPRVAGLATLGAASLALWGAPLLWISGSQDLWMLCWSLATLLLVQDGRTKASLGTFVLALLSKETSAVLPSVLVAYLFFIERQSLKQALVRTAPHLLIVVAWAALHPTLMSRLVTGGARTIESETRPPIPVIIVRTALSTINADLLPRPHEVTTATIAWGVLGLLSVVAGALWIMRVTDHRDGDAHPRGSASQVKAFATVWMTLGWVPLVMPSISWHAYYGCFGALGAWLLIAFYLSRAPRLAIAVLGLLVVLRASAASTPSWDWGNEWYQRRAGNILEAIRADLRRQHPRLPSYSRVYFGNIPNNIGLVAGKSPAIRVWYGDSTLSADFYSSYLPRGADKQAGRDLFFRFDTLKGLIEIRSGAEDLREGMASDPRWEANHEALAMLLLRAGDTQAAAVEFEKLSLLRHRGDATLLAAVCWGRIGDQVRTDSLLKAGQARLRLSDEQLAGFIDRLQATFPGRR